MSKKFLTSTNFSVSVPLTNWDSTEGRSPGPIIVISRALLHSVRSAAFPFFLPLEAPLVIFKNSPGRSGFIYLAIQYFLTDSHPPYDPFNHTVYHTVLHPLPCLPSQLISTTACKTFALPKEGPLNFCGSCSPAELAGGLFWWKNYSNKTSIFFSPETVNTKVRS